MTSLGDDVFSGCSNLDEVNIPQGITEIDNRLFLDCTDLTTIVIPNSITKIGFCAFSGCTSLSSVTIGSSVDEIVESAFWACTSLTSITIPASVTKIGTTAFKDCTNLATVTIQGNPAVRPDAFSGTSYGKTFISYATVNTTSKTYNGNQQTASSITVTLNNSTLTNGTDYDITANAGGTNAGDYTVTVTGKGSYAGTASGTFTISKISITPEISISGWTYGSSANSPSISSGNPGNGSASYTYYTNSGCTTQTSTSNGASSSGAVPTYAGTYWVKGTVAATSNYNSGTSAAASFTIAPKEVSITWSNTSFEYNNTSRVPTATVNNLVSGTSCSVTVTGGQTNVGQNYTATANSLSNSNYKLPSTKPTTQFSITAKEVGLSWGTTSLTYNGDTQAPTCTATGLISGTTCNVTVTGEKKNVGSYTAMASSLSNSNYKLPSSNTRSFSIAAKSLTITANAQSKTYGDADPTLTYTSQGLVGSDQISGAMTRATGEDVGTYAISQGTLSAGTNYSISYTGANLTINQRTATLSWANTSLTYTGQSQQPTCMVSNLKSGDACNVTVTGAQTDAGNHTATASSLDNSNYALPSTKTTSFTIAAKSLTVTADAKSKTYGDADPMLTYTSQGLVGNDQITGALTRAAGKNVGEYTINQGTLSAGNNYSISYTSNKLTIGKKTATLSWSNTALTYSGQNQRPTCTVSNKESGDDCNVTVSVEGGDSKDANTYTATASGLSNTNYELPAANTTEFTISPKEVGLTWGETSFSYTGSTQVPTCTATGLIGTDVCSVTVEGEATAAGNHTATASSLSNSNYALPEANTTEFTITALAATVSFGGNPDETKDYGDANYTKTATKTGDGTIGYSSGNTEVAEVNASTGEVTIKAAGTAVITATVTGNTNYDYATATATYTLTVNKANAACTTAPTGLTLDWTGESLTLVTEGTAEGGEMQYKLGANGTYGTGLPTATEPGSYTIYYKVEGDNNHNNVAEQSVTATITKALESTDVTINGTTTEQNVTLSVGVFPYDGNAHVPEIVVKDGDTVIPATVTYKDGNNQTIAAADIKALGTYTAELTFTAPYTGTATAQFTIYLPGDVTGDGNTSTGDLSAVINLALGKTNSAWKVYAADLNGDNQVTIGDVVMMKNILIGNNTSARRKKPADKKELEVQ